MELISAINYLAPGISQELPTLKEYFEGVRVLPVCKQDQAIALAYIEQLIRTEHILKYLDLLSPPCTQDDHKFKYICKGMNKNKKSSFFQKTLRLKLEPNTNVEEQIGGLYMFVENTSSFIDIMCSAIVQAAQLAGGDIQKGISAGVHVLNEKTAQLIEVGPASDDQRLFNIVLIQTEDMKYLQLYSKTPQLNPKVLHFSNPLAFLTLESSNQATTPFQQNIHKLIECLCQEKSLHFKIFANMLDQRGIVSKFEEMKKNRANLNSFVDLLKPHSDLPALFISKVEGLIERRIEIGRMIEKYPQIVGMIEESICLKNKEEGRRCSNCFLNERKYQRMCVSLECGHIVCNVCVHNQMQFNKEMHPNWLIKCFHVGCFHIITAKEERALYLNRTNTSLQSARPNFQISCSVCFSKQVFHIHGMELQHSLCRSCILGYLFYNMRKNNWATPISIDSQAYQEREENNNNYIMPIQCPFKDCAIPLDQVFFIRFYASQLNPMVNTALKKQELGEMKNPIPILAKDRVMKECSLCFKEFHPVADMILNLYCEGEHPVCKKGLKDYILMKLQLGKGYCGVVCPYKKCEKEYHPSTLKQAVKEEVVDKLIEQGIKGDLKLGLTTCPRCTEIFEVPKGIDSINVQCLYCSFQFCRLCTQQAHTGQCQFRQQLLMQLEKDGIRAVPCPYCLQLSEKIDDNCDRVKCLLCQNFFCSKCGAKHAIILAHSNSYHRPSCEHFDHGYKGPDQYSSKCERCIGRKKVGVPCPRPANLINNDIPPDEIDFAGINN